MSKVSIFIASFWPLLLPALSGASFLLGQEVNRVEIVEGTERHNAMRLHGEKARLIGFLCGNHDATVIAEHEDEFPDGCKEIRMLRDEQ